MKRLWKLFVAVHIFLYRRTGGRIGNFGRAQFGILLLTTIGRKTGQPHTTPLGYRREDGYYVIIASNAGLEQNPGWYFNLKHEPRVEIQINATRMRARAEEVAGAERDRLWEKLITVAPGYARYENQNARKIPLVALHPDGAVGQLSHQESLT